jgi:hypothetical protein
MYVKLRHLYRFATDVMLDAVHFPSWRDIGIHVYRRAVSIPKNADRAIREIASSLAIFADRSEKAGVYRDCLDGLVSGIWGSATPGTIDEESRREITGMV